LAAFFSFFPGQFFIPENDPRFRYCGERPVSLSCKNMVSSFSFNGGASDGESELSLETISVEPPPSLGGSVFFVAFYENAPFAPYLFFSVEGPESAFFTNLPLAFFLLV